MGLLDQKERILDVVLTDKGRELLSKNQLNFKYFAFSDKNINYSGSLSASITVSSSLDDYLHRNLTLEAGQKKQTNPPGAGATNLSNLSFLTKNGDLEDFLYTIPSKSEILPEFKTNFDGRETIDINRRYYVDEQFFSNVEKRNETSEPEAVIARAVLPAETLASRVKNYVSQQWIKVARSKLNPGNIIGLPLSANHIAVSSHVALNTTTGLISPVPVLSDKEKITVESEPVITSSFLPEETVEVKREVEVVVGAERKKIEFNLKTSEGEVESTNGYLIEVYLSGSDGKLTKLVENDTVNPLSDDILEEGFDSFLFLRTDR